MPISLSVIAFQKVILCEDRLTPQLRPLVTKILEKIPRHDNKVSYQYEANVYHCLVENEILYLCMTDTAYQSRTVFGFLGDVKAKFKEQFSGSEHRYPKHSDLTPTACARFNTTLAQTARYYNENPEGDKIGRIKEQIDNVKQVMLENIDTVLERGERIESLCDRTEALAEEAEGFHRNSRTLKRKMQMRNIKLAIGIFLLVCILAFIISWIACGIKFEKCKSDDSPAPTPAPFAPVPATPVPATPSP